MQEWTLFTTPLPSELAAICLSVHITIFITNILVIATFTRMKKLVLLHYYMLGLVVADLIILIPSTTGIMALIKGELWINGALCKLLGIAATSSIEITTVIHTAMCIDRWVSVAYPITYRELATRRHAKTKTILIILACTLIPITFNVVTSLTGDITFDFNPFIPNCAISSQTSTTLGTMLTMLLFILGPMIVHAVSNIYLLSRVAKLKGLSRRRLFHSIRTVVITVLIYYIFYAPTAVRLAMAVAAPHKQSMWFTFISTEILVAASGVSFFIYASTIIDFRKALLSIFQNKKRRIQCAETRITTTVQDATTDANYIETKPESTAITSV